ncbi:hypothetical protein GGS20DRAFT_570219 [Poronia punctata]|nr:hypothetical protein GGS20DRAFT_570219 [Poronia punctata]
MCTYVFEYLRPLLFLQLCGVLLPYFPSSSPVNYKYDHGSSVGHEVFLPKMTDACRKTGVVDGVAPTASAEDGHHRT